MRRLAFGSVLLVLLAGVASAAGAATEDIKVCKLLTKKEASRILDEKVVRTEAARDKSIDAVRCEYKTKKFIDSEFEELDAPIQLSIDIQGITKELQSDLDDSRAAGDEIEGVGDYAFRTNTGATIAVVEDLALEAGYQNSGSVPSDIAEEKEAAALKLVIRRLPKA